MAINISMLQVGGITLPIMREALLQARDGRKHILGKVNRQN